MPDFANVFKRKEQKYKLCSEQLDLIMPIVRERMVPDVFGESAISSLYYDTPHYELIERSLDKPLFKEKLRLRVYGEPSPEAKAFVGIKKKYKGIVYKRRIAMTLAAAEAYLAGLPYEEACAEFPFANLKEQKQSFSPLSLQISREIDFFMERYSPLAPSMLIRCDRAAFFDPCATNLRITLDTNLTADPAAQNLQDSGTRFDIIPSDEGILEIKNEGPLPLWLTDALSQAKAYPQSFSKYGAAYMHGRKRSTCQPSCSESIIPGEKEKAIA